MTTDRIRVWAVGHLPAWRDAQGKPYPESWLVSGSFTDGRLGCLQVDTTDQWMAAAAQRSKETGRAVLVTWKDGSGRGFKDAVSVTLEPQTNEAA